MSGSTINPALLASIRDDRGLVSIFLSSESCCLNLAADLAATSNACAISSAPLVSDIAFQAVVTWFCNSRRLRTALSTLMSPETLISLLSAIYYILPPFLSPVRPCRHWLIFHMGLKYHILIFTW